MYIKLPTTVPTVSLQCAHRQLATTLGTGPRLASLSPPGVELLIEAYRFLHARSESGDSRSRCAMANMTALLRGEFSLPFAEIYTTSKPHGFLMDGYAGPTASFCPMPRRVTLRARRHSLAYLPLPHTPPANSLIELCATTSDSPPAQVSPLQSIFFVLVVMAPDQLM